MEGIIFTLLSAASFGANNIVVRRGLLKVSAGQGLYITVLLGIPLFATAAWVTGQMGRIDQLTPMGMALLATAGVIHFILGRYWTFRAVAALGANRTMPIQATSGFYSVIIAVIFLREALTVLTAIGIVLVMLGPALIAEGSRREARVTRKESTAAPLRPSIQKGEAALSEGRAEYGTGKLGSDSEKAPPPPTRLAEGYVFGLLSALAYGTSPVFIRAALQDTAGLGIAGGFISYVAAGSLLVLGLLIPRKRPNPWSELRRERRQGLWFVFAGVGVFLAQLFRYLALAFAPVSLVVPLTHTRPIFTAFFSYVFNRHLESFAPSTLIGIGLSVIGAVAIGIGSI